MRVRAVALSLFALCGACAKGTTSLLITADGPSTTQSLSVAITLGSSGVTTMRTLPLGPRGATLPGRIVVDLPDVSSVVTIDLTGENGSTVLTAHAQTTCQPHRQTSVSLTLTPTLPNDFAGVDSAGLDLTMLPLDVASATIDDLTGTAPLDTAVPSNDAAFPADLQPLADLKIPTDLVVPGDLASTDQAVGPFAPRVIANAYFTGGSGTAGMSADGYAMSTAGAYNGDLLLFIANIDNGSGNVFHDPPLPGFHTLSLVSYGQDTQTFVAAWKIANNEPATYSMAYGPDYSSHSVTLTLVAVSGASQTTPINQWLETHSNAESTKTIVSTSAGVTTTVDGCLILYAAGADWRTPAFSSFTVGFPTGFTSLSAFGDHGDLNFDWTTQMVGYEKQTTHGVTGAISGTLVSGNNTVAGPWNIVIAVAPGP